MEAATRKMVKRTLQHMVEAGRLDPVHGPRKLYRLGGVVCRMSHEAIQGWQSRPRHLSDRVCLATHGLLPKLLS